MECVLAAQSNCTTVEPMTEAEAVQVVKDLGLKLDYLYGLIYDELKDGKSFFDAQKKAIQILKGEVKVFCQYPPAIQMSSERSFKDNLERSFPQITAKSVVALIKWRRRLLKKIPSLAPEYYKQEEGLRGRAENFVRKTGCVEEDITFEGYGNWDILNMKKIQSVYNAFKCMIDRRRRQTTFIPLKALHFHHAIRVRGRATRVVRTAAKSDDDGDCDGDSDGPSDPPGPNLAVPSLHNSHDAIELNSSILSRTPHPCSWRMERRWVA